MKTVKQAIRLLVVIQFISNYRCQDGFGERDLLRLQQMASNDGQIETITSYSTNIIQRDPNSQSISSVSVQYHMTDPEKNEEFNRADRTRTRKVYRIKNPFDHQNQQDDLQETNTAESQDTGTGASNQYAAMQYSLPPEEFLQQMRAENQFYQQQASTQAPHLSYTATPQPQYQYSTISPNYDDNHQSNQIPQLEPKASVGQNYLTNPNSYQYGGNGIFNFDGVQSTPASVTPHLSTPLPNNQFVGTQSSSYVSSSSPIYISSPPNLQHYVSSPLSNIQDVSPDYSNRVSSTIGSNAINYENEFHQKKMLIDHYDNSAHGVRYPVNMQQYQNDYPSSTPNPSSSPYSDQGHDPWQNQRPNSVSKSIQELSYTQYPNYPSDNNNNNNNLRSAEQQDNIGSDNQRIGNVPAANTLYLNYAQPEFQQENAKGRTRSYDDNGQNNYYSHGDYGWKLQNKKSLVSTENYPQGSFSRYQFPNQQMALQSSPGTAVSQMNFHMDTSRQQAYEQNSKSSADIIDAQDFARAAAKAQERQHQQQQQQQQQQIYGNYPSNYNLPSPTPGPNYGNNDKQRNRYNENINSNNYPYNNLQTDLITAPPYYYLNSKENTVDTKPKLPFDHDKALKNIVPIDVSNVVGNSEPSIRGIGGQDNNNRYNIANFGKSQLEENLKQYYRSVTDAYYKDKNSIYGFNIKSRPEDVLNSESKQLDSNIQIYAKQPQIQESIYNQGNLQDKRYFEGSGSTPTYASSPSSIQSSANIQQQGLQRPQNVMPNDIANILKLNDVPYRFTSGLSEGDSLRLHNNNNFDTVIPTSLPSRINQNVGSHQLDVSILNKLLNKQAALNLNRPDIDPQASGLISNINGFKVANPFNVDLKLVADMLKGKPAVDDSHLLSLGNQFTKTVPLKLDLSQLQQLLLKNDNNGGYASINDELSAFSNPYLDFYSPGRPYQGVKYSRSQEEEESESIIPIADASNNHPIGAVMEQLDEITNEREVTGSDVTAQDDEALLNNYKKRPKNGFITRHRIGERHRHPNSLPDQRTYPRRYPKSHTAEPYPLLKPPPPQKTREARNNFDKNSKRRRAKPKLMRVLKTEPLYEAGANIDDDEATVPTLLQPPPQIADAKMDKISEDDAT
ncbi:myb-like protein AA [Plodia interpunctella]|uniref:myb-like protein AA n=1 Tax=Plodia interpunctella TaxID=58824 RepID=UPI002367E09F|nr:myb-like protein AA [Plodia interpunctella]